MKKQIRFSTVLLAAITCAAFLAPAAQAQFQWANRIASANSWPEGEPDIGLALDTNDNCYVTGFFDDTNNFGGVTLTNQSTGGSDIFVAKYSATGALQWVQRAGGSAGNFNYGRGLGTDTNGNIYVTGGYQSPATFGSINPPATSGEEFFLAKYNNSGAVQWVQPSTGGSDDVSGIGLTVDGAGNSYALAIVDHLGGAGGSVTFGSTTVTIPALGGTTLTILVKYDNAGTVKWARLFNSSQESYATKVAVDASGNVYVRGTFDSDMTIGTSNLVVNPGSSRNMFIAKFDSSGNLTWVDQPMGGDVQEGGVAVDPAGNVYVTGAFDGIVDFGGGISLTNAAPGALFGDAFLAKYNSYGFIQWAQSAGGTNGGFYWDVALDAQTNIYPAGFFNTGAAVAKYTSAGTLQWTESASGPPASPVASLVAKCAVDSAGNCFLAGWYQGTTSFGATTLQPQEPWNLFLAEVASYTFGPQTQSTPSASITYDSGTGTFQYTDTANSTEDFAYLPLAGTSATFITTSNAWSASVDVNISARTMTVASGKSSHVVIGLVIANANATDLVGILAAQDNNTGGGDDQIYPDGWYGSAVRFLANKNGGADAVTSLGNSLTSGNGSVYLPLSEGTNVSAATESFSNVTGILTFSYNASNNTLTGYYNGTSVGSYSLAGWGSNPPLTLTVWGGSGSAVTVPVTTATASNFSAEISAQTQYTFGPQTQSTPSASITYDSGTDTFQYTDAANSSADSARLPLTGTASTLITTSNDWTASLTANISARSMTASFSESPHVWMEFGVYYTNGPSTYLLSFSLQQENNTGGNNNENFPNGFYGTGVTLRGRTNGNDDVTMPLGASQLIQGGSVLLLSGGTTALPATESISAATGVLTLNYNASLNTVTGYFNGTPIGSYSLAGWGANPPLTLFVAGSSGEGVAVPAGTATASDFSTSVLTVANPTIQFTASPTSGSPPLTVQFNSPNVDSFGSNVVSWNWNFGDGSTSTLQNPSHVYTTLGAFSSSLVATNNNGVAVFDIGPTITVGFANLVENGGFETGDFTGWTLSGDTTSWTFVDDGSASGIQPHSGTHVAELGTTSARGYLSQTLATVPGQSYLVSLWLNSPDGLTPNEFLVNWNGNTIFDQVNMPALGWTNLQFTVIATGTSTVLQFGFRDDPSWLGLDDVSVQPSGTISPTIQFTASPTIGMSPLTVQFNSPNIDSLDNAITSWNWNFGDGSTSTLQNPSHIYTTLGIFSPTLVATNNNGVAVIGTGPQITTLMATSSTNFTYTTNNGTITITGYTGTNAVVTIPNTINGLPVTAIGVEAFYENSLLKSVTIGTNVTSIGVSAFLYCSLTNVTIPSSVTSIGESAFHSCRGLTSVAIPSSVTSIGIEAFGACTSLMAITVDAQNSFYSSLNGVLFDKSQTTLVEFPAGVGGSYTIPNSVTSIGEAAFYSGSLTNVTIPNSVTNIGEYAFVGGSLTAITVDAQNSFYSSLNGVLFDKSQATLVEIPGEWVRSYTIPNSVTSIGVEAFYAQYGLTNITIPNSVTSIGVEAFYNCGLTSVTIPSSVTHIGDYAFAYCYGLTGAYFLGNAFSLDLTVFLDDPVTIYYLPGTSGWSSTFGGVPTAQWFLPKPLILNNGSGFGVQTSGFGFTISWATNISVVVEACTNLANPMWQPVATNTLSNGFSSFSDSKWTNSRAGFYRIRSP